MKVNYYENFKYVKSTSAFKIYIIMMLLVNVYCSFAIARTAFVGLLPFVESIVAIMNFSYYHVFEIVSILFINFQTIKFFKDNQFQLIRLKDKKTSIETMLRQSVYNCIICYIIQLLFFFISLILFHTFGIQNVTLAKELGNLVYAFFLLIRSFCFMLIIVVINSLLLYLIKDKLVLILDILLLVGVIDYSTMFPILSLSKNVQIPLFISGYFISFSNNFSLELCISLGYLLLSIIFCYILYKTVVNQNKNMIDN